MPDYDPLTFPMPATLTPEHQMRMAALNAASLAPVFKADDLADAGRSVLALANGYVEWLDSGRNVWDDPELAEAFEEANADARFGGWGPADDAENEVLAAAREWYVADAKPLDGPPARLHAAVAALISFGDRVV